MLNDNFRCFNTHLQWSYSNLKATLFIWCEDRQVGGALCQGSFEVAGGLRCSVESMMAVWFQEKNSGGHL